MITNLYFIRHAKSDERIRDDENRPLTESGLLAAQKISRWFEDIQIDKIISSPYKRVLQTLEPISKKLMIEIETEYDLRERKNSKWFEDKNEHIDYLRKIWTDQNYKIENEESIYELKKRNMAVINRIIKTHNDMNIVIGTHGMAMCSILNNYLNFGFDYFIKIWNKMPYLFILEIEDGIVNKWEEKYMEEV